MDETKIRNSFRNIKRDIEEIKDYLKKISKEIKFPEKGEFKSAKRQASGRIFTSKVSITEDMKKAVNDVFDSGMFSLGEKNKEFEKKFSEYYGIKHAIAVSNGTISIELILKSLGIGEGDEVIVPSHTTMPTVEPILHIGAKPIFIDCLKNTYNINPKDVEKKITDKTRAIIVVHLYGNPAHIEELSKICKRRKIYLIEDCAQAHGARYKNRHVGTFGIAGSFSFYPTKNMTVCGEGGMVITNDDKIAKEIRMMSNHGEDGRYNHVILGGNYRLSEIQCAIGIKQLELLESFVERRRQIAEIYDEEFKFNDKIICPKETENAKHSFHLYVIRVKSKIRNKILDEMKKENVFLGIHYPTPVHLQPVIKKMVGLRKLKVTEKITKEIISLPIYPSLKNDEARMIARKIKKIVNKLD